MGREIRRVPPNFQHPSGKEFLLQGVVEEGYWPLYDGAIYEEEALEWEKNHEEWKNPENRGQIGHDNYKAEPYYFNWALPPIRDQYTKVKKEECTWYQLYETVSEGTPMSPPFETEEELIDYLVEHGDFWHQKSPQAFPKFSREVLTQFVKEHKGCVAFVIDSVGGLQDGIEAVYRNPDTLNEADLEPLVSIISNIPEICLKKDLKKEE